MFNHTNVFKSEDSPSPTATPTSSNSSTKTSESLILPAKLDLSGKGRPPALDTDTEKPVCKAVTNNVAQNKMIIGLGVKKELPLSINLASKNITQITEAPSIAAVSSNSTESLNSTVSEPSVSKSTGPSSPATSIETTSMTSVAISSDVSEEPKPVVDSDPLEVQDGPPAKRSRTR